MVKSLGADEPVVRQKALALEIFHGNKPWMYALKTPIAFFIVLIVL